MGVTIYADIALHDKGDGSTHAHILLTMRTLIGNALKGCKTKKYHILDKNGEKIKLKRKLQNMKTGYG